MVFDYFFVVLVQWNELLVNDGATLNLHPLRYIYIPQSLRSHQSNWSRSSMMLKCIRSAGRRIPCCKFPERQWPLLRSCCRPSCLTTPVWWKTLMGFYWFMFYPLIDAARAAKKKRLKTRNTLRIAIFPWPLCWRKTTTDRAAPSRRRILSSFVIDLSRDYLIIPRGRTNRR